mgnify:CR=1 FL=1
MSNVNLIAEARRNAPHSIDGHLLSRLANALEEAEAILALAEGGAA